jgi:hypothetical protein
MRYRMLTMIDYAKQRAAQAKDLSIKIASEHEAALGSYSPGHWSGLTGTKCPLQADYRDFLEVQFHHRPQHRRRLNVAEVP